MRSFKIKSWFVPVIALIIFDCDFLGSYDQVGHKDSNVKEHSQLDRHLPSRIDISEKHELFYETLKDIYSGYGTDVMKILAFLLICIGWFITSDKSREFFRNNRAVRISSILALVVLGIIHINSQIKTYLSSQAQTRELLALNYLDLKYYKYYEITFEQLITNAIQNAVLFVVLILIIFSMKEVTKN